MACDEAGAQRNSCYLLLMRQTLTRRRKVPASALRGQLLIGDPMLESSTHKRRQPVQSVNFDIALIQSERCFVDVSGQMLVGDVVPCPMN